MYFWQKFVPINLILCLSSRTNIAVTAAAVVSKEATDNWIPSDEFANTSSINWFMRKHNDDDAKGTKSLFARNFQDDDATTIDRAFNDYVAYTNNNEFGERDDFKAIPFQLPSHLIPSSNSIGGNSVGNSIGNGEAVHFHSTLFPSQQSQPQSNLAKPFFPAAPAPLPQTPSAPVVSSLISHPQVQPPSASYSTNIYQQPYQTPSQNLENFDYLPPAPYPSPSPFTNNGTSVELNTRHLLYLQPGKCSNSIEVGRLRDLEIRSAVKTNVPDSQKAICVLMLYSANENNKLAISMQSVVETASAELSTESWLERNVKVYSLQGGTISRTSTDANYGPGAPALILTKSSIVLLSIVSDRTLDFQIDISTYQSHHC
ncbi:uncharacterized protein pyd3 isoform X2 [Planococcus citri]|uniref:uncharacterized protein pyd3 isoform X2 n=1 Tax=Planococcus citri TaxID=170843 RepID=UPI0031F86A22